MKNHVIDNSVDLGDVILWQYQHAENLKKLVEFYDDFFKKNVKEFHDDWRDKVFNIEDSGNADLDKFSLSLWGMLLGFARPTYVNGGGVVTPISDAFYRKLLKARFRVMRSNASLTAILKYLDDAFDGNVMVDDTSDMALHYSVRYPQVWKSGTPATMNSEFLAVMAQDPDSILVYPAGVKTNEPVDEFVFGFSGQQKVSSTDPEIGGLDDSTFVVEEVD